MEEYRFKKANHSSYCKTRFLYVAGVGDSLNTSEASLYSVFYKYGEIECIVMPENCRMSYIVYKNIQGKEEEAENAAQRALEELSGNAVPELNSSNLYIQYAELSTVPIQGSGLPSEPEDVSIQSTQNINVPGCQVINEFITQEEEDLLLKGINGEVDGWNTAKWELILNRRVQHYGFPFNYRTLLLDYAAETPEIPTACTDLGSKMMKEYNNIIEKNGNSMVEEGSKDMPITQLTINEYEPGQGIAGHIDSHACFGPIIFILSCNAGITMTLQKREDGNEDKGNDECKYGSDSKCQLPVGTKRYLWLPKRSLLILYGDARRKWSHSIATRRFDKVNGVMMERGTRISFTFRQALALAPPIASSLINSSVEDEHVFRVYDSIALHWHHTRGKRKVHWHRVKVFLESLPKGSILADVGSGDGKYFGLNEDIISIGCDRSLRLLEVSKTDQFEVFCCDAVKLPFRDSSFDAAICIAVMHHLATIDRRVAVIAELVRIVRPGGRIMVQAWAQEQEQGSKRTFEKQDVFVPWRLQKRYNVDGLLEKEAEVQESEGNEFQEHNQEDEMNREDYDFKPPSHMVEERGLLTYQRYCHVYKKGELEDICRSIPGCRLVETGYDRSNWFVELECVKDDRLRQEDISQPMAFPAFTPRTL